MARWIPQARRIIRRGEVNMLLHERYQSLCAIAASGAASENEFEELISHVGGCGGCRATMHNLIKVVADTPPDMAGHEVTDAHQWQSEESLGTSKNGPRSVVRAPLGGSRPTFQGSWCELWRPIAWTALVTVTASILVGFVLFNLYLQTHISPPSQQQTSLTQPAVKHPSDADNESNREFVRQSADLTNQLHKEKMRVSELETKVTIDQEKASAADAEKGQLLSRAAAADGTIADLRRTEVDRNQRIAELETEVAEKNAELTTVNVQLTTIRAELNVERQRNAALVRAQNLIAARNLHVVDVHDSDPDPKRQKAFGRILYTENRSLIFYAYDLDDPGQRTFHAWGQKLGDAKSIRSLGIFTSDDIPDKRWRLTLDDPAALAQVNSVFVTIEAHNTVGPKPSGEKVLSAYLGSKANHP